MQGVAGHSEGKIQGYPLPSVPNLPLSFSSESLGIPESVSPSQFTGDKHLMCPGLAVVVCAIVALA